MKLIAHRGWAEGREENTLAAFARAAGEDRISGVELDVRRARDGRTLLVAHDPPPPGADTPPLDAALALLAATRLELLVELKEPGLAAEVIDMLAARGLADRALIFAFAPVARSFPWPRPRRVRLGVIVEYPWHLDRIAQAFAPDVLALGWDARAWTRLAFRGWWSLFSLSRTADRLGVPIIAGIAQRSDDLDWLARQRVYAAVADMDRIMPAPLTEGGSRIADDGSRQNY